eukprot:1160142-Pelagomonas_calceolata.AAC.33
MSKAHVDCKREVQSAWDKQLIEFVDTSGASYVEVHTRCTMCHQRVSDQGCSSVQGKNGYTSRTTRPCSSDAAMHARTHQPDLK